MRYNAFETSQTSVEFCRSHGLQNRAAVHDDIKGRFPVWQTDVYWVNSLRRCLRCDGVHRNHQEYTWFISTGVGGSLCRIRVALPSNAGLPTSLFSTFLLHLIETIRNMG